MPKARPKRLTPAMRAERELGIGGRWSPDGAKAPPGFHLVMRLSDDRVIAPTVAARRTLSEVVYAQGETRGLIAFRAADTHLHIVLVCTREEAGLFARYTMISLRWLLELGAPFERCSIRPLVDRRHLENAVRYLFKQEAHHGIVLDPFHDASSLIDHVGLRVLGRGTSARLSAALPRVSKSSLLELGGLAWEPIDPAPHAFLIEATLAATGLLALGLDPRSHAARCAAAHAVTMPATELAPLLGVAAASVRRLRQQEPEGPLVTAIQRQLSLRSSWAARARSA